MAKEKDSVRKKTKAPKLSTQRYLQFTEVHDDTLVLKNGGLRAVLEVNSVNFNLKSEEEQTAIISSYQQMLNALNFPVQIIMRSRKLDIEHYLEDLRQRRKKIDNDLLRKQMEEYIEYITKLVEYSDIMEKRFFVVVPANPLRAEKKTTWTNFLSYIRPDDTVMDIVKRRREFADMKKELDSRLNVVQTALENCGLSVKKLNTEQLIALFYQAYNPDLARMQKVHTAKDFAMETDLADGIEVEEG